MTRSHRCILLCTLLGLLLAALQNSGVSDETKAGHKSETAKKLFTATIRPLLQKKCLGCHGDGDDIEGRLDMRTRTSILKGGENGPALVPGKPEKSPMYLAVLRDGDLVMPPKERNKLAPKEIAALKTWILAGAPWIDSTTTKHESKGTSETDSADAVTIATSGGLLPEWTNRKYKSADTWAYRPVQRHAVPWNALKKLKTKSLNAIDAFVARKLIHKKLASAPAADKRTLLRRVTLDLTGLPPTPAESDAFLKDDSPNAFQKVIRRLMNSKHYGEHAARHWLDVVRYADTSGYSNDYERPNAWRYRDYVIRSFNNDKPFDRFIIEQIAGDELDGSNAEMLIAAGFLRMGPWEHTGMSVATVTRQLFLDDITNSVGVTFLAQGLRCARCHDHKFDPIPTRDYYRMQAAFAPVQFADRKVAHQPYENISSFAESKQRTERLLKEARDVLASLKRKSDTAIGELLKKHGVKKFADVPKGIRPNRRFYGLSKRELSISKVHFKRVAYFEREMKRYQDFAFSVYNGPLNGFTSNRSVFQMPAAQKRRGPPQDVFILTGGALESPGEIVSPGVVSAVAGSNDAAAPSAWNSLPKSTHGRRLALARWIASPSNTLTARVIVNRIWQQHFAGPGIVATANNFGKMGSKPTHPELLDWLATWFVEHDWSIKRLRWLILTSETYQRSGNHPDAKELAQTDPNNALLSVYPSRRLTAEEIRDGLLRITGELNSEMGGPGIFPEINEEVAMQPRHIMGSVAPAYQPSPRPEQRNRRTIYCFRIRTLANPMLEVFNQPNSEVSCERRDETTIAPQAFALFNGQFVHDRALALAARLKKATDDRSQQVNLVFRNVYGRLPSDDERSACLQHIDAMTEHHRQLKPIPVKRPISVRREMTEELTGDVNFWDEPLDLAKVFVPDLKPWDVDAETRGLAELCLVLMNSNEFLYVY